MNAYYDLKDMLCDELQEFAKKGELSAGDLEAVDKLTHSIKSLVTIIAMEDGGYSNDGYDHGSSYGYDRGYSGRRYANRDSMGRYSPRRYSRDEAKDEVIRHMEKLMNDMSGKDREVVQDAVNQLKNM